MHTKIPKICTGCRVSAAKIYLYHSTKIAKARPHSEEWQIDTSVQKQWSMDRVTGLWAFEVQMYPPILVRWMMQYYLKTVKIISSDTHIVPYSRYLVRTNNNNIVLHILMSCASNYYVLRIMPDKKSGIKKNLLVDRYEEVYHIKVLECYEQ